MKLPDDIPFDLACLVSCGVPTGWGAAVNAAEVRPGDVVQYERNAEYWDAGKPFFDEVEMKGGGDATAFFQSNVGDFAATTSFQSGSDRIIFD